MILSLSCIFLVSCNETPENSTSGTNLHWMEDSVVTFNHQIVKTEIQEIDDFILRYHWEMKKTPTGLRVMIYQKGEGPYAKGGDIVAIKYKINLLNGDLVFKSDSISPFTVEVGKREMISGLDEGIMLMKKGGRAKMIVPSHLAYGLLGDMATIPAGAVLVLDVELCAINQPKQ
jgi:FKBP-type peptidyl-prolyl cis-trans isomerase FkpA